MQASSSLHLILSKNSQPCHANEVIVIRINITPSRRFVC